VPLLEAVVEESRAGPRLLVLSAGYERREWRAAALARHVLEWVEDFAMRPTEREELGTGRSVSMIERAMLATFGRRGGTAATAEVLLHAVCRQFFGSSTVIHKIFFKTAANDQVKGYDGVHVVHTASGEFQLWLGEAKFYQDIGDAIRSALADLRAHFTVEYVRSEFGVVADRIAHDHPHREELRQIMDPATSIEDVFDRVVVPVFCTYDSEATVKHEQHCDEYRSDVATEAVKALTQLKAGIDAITANNDVAVPADIRLFLLPLATKGDLVDALEARLNAWRAP
jgi:hypothetical protein